MKGLAIVLWTILILSMSPVGLILGGIGVIFYAGCWLYVEIKRYIEIRRLMKGE